MIKYKKLISLILICIILTIGLSFSASALIGTPTPTPSPTKVNYEKKGFLNCLFAFDFNCISDKINNWFFRNYKNVPEDPKEKIDETSDCILKDLEGTPCKVKDIKTGEKPITDSKSGDPDVDKKQEPVKILNKQSSASLGTDRGHAILVPMNSLSKIIKVEIYGSIYDNGNKRFDIEIWDKNLKTLQSSSYNYVDYFPNGGSPPDAEDFSWATIDIPDIDVNDDFYIALFTYSGPPSWHEKEEYQRVPLFVRGGIEIGVDIQKTAAINSYVVDRNPNRIVDWPKWDLKQESINWKIKAIVSNEY